jgi:hypothetical protein
VASPLLRYFAAHSSAAWVLHLANTGPLLGARSGPVILSPADWQEWLFHCP